MDERTATIQKLYDEHRKHFYLVQIKVDERPPALPTYVWTQGIDELGFEKLAQLSYLVRRYDAFNEGNDPYGEHDFGSIDFEGARIFWNIDY